MTDSGSDNLRDELARAMAAESFSGGGEELGTDEVAIMVADAVEAAVSVVERRVAAATAEHSPHVERLIELVKDYVECVDGEWGCCHTYDEVVARENCSSNEIATELESIIRALASGQEEK